MEKQSFIKTWGIIIALSVIKLIIHLITINNYGFHRDEFLYLAESDHLALGYMSVPPSIAYIGWIVKFLFGDSLLTIRMIPAILGSLTVMFTMLIVKEMGGKNFAQLLAGLAIILSPVILRINSLFQPVSFDLFYWTLITYFIVRFITTHDPTKFIWIGIVIGIGLINKYLIFLLAISLIIGLFLTKNRKVLKMYYAYVGSFIALLIFLPNILWQYHHHFPVIEHLKELNDTQLVNVSKINFLLDQILFNYVSSVFWITGLIFLVFSREGKKFRIIGWMYLSIICILLFFGGKSYYSSGIYPVLIAMGAFYFEKIRNKILLNFTRAALISILIIALIPVIPICLHLLPGEKLESHCDMLMNKYSLDSPMRWEDGKIHPIPQDYADMFGWDELAEKVITTFSQLSADEQSNCFIYCQNYGEAGAIDYYGDLFNLPKAISFSDNYLLWAPDSITQNIGIIVNAEESSMEKYFEEYKIVGSITNKYARESGVMIFLVKNPKELFYHKYRHVKHSPRNPD